MFYTFWAMVLFLFLFSIIAYLLLPTFVKMWQKRAQKAPFGASEASGVRSYDYIVTYLSLTSSYVLLTFLLTYYLIKTFQNCSRDAPTERAKRAEYVHITYLLRTDYLFIT